MRENLLELGLSEKLIDEILEAFTIYQQSLEQYSKPAGKAAMQDNIKEVESLSRKLKKRLDKLSKMEQQLLNYYTGYPKIFDMKTFLIRLETASSITKSQEVRFSRAEPFLIDFTISTWRLLENHNHQVTIYKDNILCKILDLLVFSERPRSAKAEKDVVDDLRALNLVRKASKRISKK